MKNKISPLTNKGKVYNPIVFRTPLMWTSEIFSSYYNKYKTNEKICLFTEKVCKLLVTNEVFNIKYLVSLFPNLIELDVSNININLYDIKSNSIKILRINSTNINSLMILNTNIPNLEYLYAKNNEILDFDDFIISNNNIKFIEITSNNKIIIYDITKKQ